MCFSFVKRTLAVGAETYKLEVTVKNKGDDAYNAKLYVTIPKGIKIGRIFTLRDGEGEDVSIFFCKSSITTYTLHVVT